MQLTTLTEQRLCRMWAATAHGGDFYELSKTLHEIAQVLISLNHGEAAELFADASQIALWRAVEKIRDHESLGVAA